MTGIVYIATSLDGFIARKDGGLDWLPSPDDESDSDSGFNTFLESVDALVMGRNTYDMVQSFGVWAYGDKPVFVLSHRPIDPPQDSVARVDSISGTPEKIVSDLAGRNLNNLYIDGGETIQEFLRAGEIHRIILVAVTIIKTVTIDPSPESLGLLATTIVIRTILSWTTMLEVNGRWPWQKPVTR